MLHHLEPRERHSALVILVCELILSFRRRSVGPSVHWRDNNKDCFLGLVLMERLSQDLNNFFGLIEISSTDKINQDAIGADNRLAKRFWLAMTVHNPNLIVRRRDIF